MTSSRLARPLCSTRTDLEFGLFVSTNLLPGLPSDIPRLCIVSELLWFTAPPFFLVRTLSVLTHPVLSLTAGTGRPKSTSRACQARILVLNGHSALLGRAHVIQGDAESLDVFHSVGGARSRLRLLCEIAGVFTWRTQAVSGQKLC